MIFDSISGNHVIRQPQPTALDCLTHSKTSNAVAGYGSGDGHANGLGSSLQCGAEPIALAALGCKASVGYHTLSSLLGSATSTAVFYPFDFIRTRYMSQDGTMYRQHNAQAYSSMLRSFRVVLKEEGVRTLFRGCSVAICGSAVAWGLYMSLYRVLCNAIDSSSYPRRFLLSIIASMAASIISNPIFLLKSRMQLEETAKSTLYRTFRSGFLHAARTSGVRSLWRGTSMQLLLVFPNALGLPTYDYLKSIILHYRWEHTELARDLSIYEVVTCSAITKILVILLSHPLMTIRVRLQDQRSRIGTARYCTAPQAFRTVLRLQGVPGFYRGFCASALYTLPRSVMCYLVYEKTLHLLQGHKRIPDGYNRAA